MDVISLVCGAASKNIGVFCCVLAAAAAGNIIGATAPRSICGLIWIGTRVEYPPPAGTVANLAPGNVATCVVASWVAGAAGMVWQAWLIGRYAMEGAEETATFFVGSSTKAWASCVGAVAAGLAIMYVMGAGDACVMEIPAAAVCELIWETACNCGIT